MTSFRVPPICSAIDKRSGRTATVYKPYWSTDGRFPVIFQGTPRLVWIVALKHLEPQHIINQELAVQYGFTQGPINATDQQQETGPPG
jgi:hypothetical protein